MDGCVWMGGWVCLRTSFFGLCHEGPRRHPTVGSSNEEEPCIALGNVHQQANQHATAACVFWGGWELGVCVWRYH